ncbi:MAG: LytR C-terminal domain-containing protein [Pseudomonadota bacterium]
MDSRITRIASFGAGTMLMACAASIGPPAARGPGDADALYAQGRALHLAGHGPDRGQAAAAYRSALALDPAHVAARNGLAALAAEEGDLARAIGQWRALTEDAAAKLGADAAYLYANLGYAFLLDGRYAQALAALERACLLDPLHEQAWQHMGQALEKLGQGERAQRALTQAAALRAHDLRADFNLAAAAPAPARVPAPTPTPTPISAPGWHGAEVRLTGDGIVDLAAPLAASARTAAAPRARTAAAAAGPLLEIRNGNGVTGMAAALARSMAAASLRVVRLSNEKGFAVQRTRVEYAPPMRAAAAALAGRLGTASLRAVDNCAPADMRVVIGRDMVGTALLSRAARPRETVPLAAL